MSGHGSHSQSHGGHHGNSWGCLSILGVVLILILLVALILGGVQLVYGDKFFSLPTPLSKVWKEATRAPADTAATPASVTEPVPVKELTYTSSCPHADVDWKSCTVVGNSNPAGFDSMVAGLIYEFDQPLGPDQKARLERQLPDGSWIPYDYFTECPGTLGRLRFIGVKDGEHVTIRYRLTTAAHPCQTGVFPTPSPSPTTSPTPEPTPSPSPDPDDEDDPGGLEIQR